MADGLVRATARATPRDGGAEARPSPVTRRIRGPSPPRQRARGRQTRTATDPEASPVPDASQPLALKHLVRPSRECGDTLVTTAAPFVLAKVLLCRRVASPLSSA